MYFITQMAEQCKAGLGLLRLNSQCPQILFALYPALDFKHFDIIYHKVLSQKPLCFLSDLVFDMVYYLIQLIQPEVIHPFNFSSSNAIFILGVRCALCLLTKNLYLTRYDVLAHWYVVDCAMFCKTHFNEYFNFQSNQMKFRFLC